MEFPIEALRNGIISGISVNGNNLIVENIMINDDRNNTVYQCLTLLGLGIPIQSDPITLYVAGECIAISCVHSYICILWSSYSQYFV